MDDIPIRMTTLAVHMVINGTGLIVCLIATLCESVNGFI